jgi:hypothetical protein
LVAILEGVVMVELKQVQVPLAYLSKVVVTQQELQGVVLTLAMVRAVVAVMGLQGVAQEQLAQ